jgi:hypothetical protein
MEEMWSSKVIQTIKPEYGGELGREFMDWQQPMAINIVLPHHHMIM